MNKRIFITITSFIIILVCLEFLIRCGFNIVPILILPLEFVNIILINNENEE